MNAPLVIGMALHNGASTVARAVESVLTQAPIDRPWSLFILEDGSIDNWEDVLMPYAGHPRLEIKQVECGSVHAVRNELLQQVRSKHGHHAYLARLDCDDELASSTVLAEMDKLLKAHRPDMLLMGNRLRQAGVLLERINRAEPRLLDDEYLESRLLGMASGDPLSELPSCNAVVRTGVDCAYLPIASAEDHWFLVDLLLRKDELHIHLAPEILYAIYSLSGKVTKGNRGEGSYATSRKALLDHYWQRRRVQ